MYFSPVALAPCIFPRDLSSLAIVDRLWARISLAGLLPLCSVGLGPWCSFRWFFPCDAFCRLSRFALLSRDVGARLFHIGASGKAVLLTCGCSGSPVAFRSGVETFLRPA